MIGEIQRLLDAYLAWLKHKTTLREVGDSVEITTPYLDRHNDYIQIFAQRLEKGYLLTDDGYTIHDLRMSGCNLDTAKRQELLKLTLNGFGAELSRDALTVKAFPENFSLRKHNLVQAILAVNDLFFTAGAVVASLFFEDVGTWLDLHSIRYAPKVKFTGKSGFDHLFDFLVPKSKQQPERIVQTINRPNRNSVQAVTFAWIDTRETRTAEAQAYAFLNDTEHTPSASTMDALRNYEVRPVMWSERESVRDILAA